MVVSLAPEMIVGNLPGIMAPGAQGAAASPSLPRGARLGTTQLSRPTATRSVLMKRMPDAQQFSLGQPWRSYMARIRNTYHFLPTRQLVLPTLAPRLYRNV